MSTHIVKLLFLGLLLGAAAYARAADSVLVVSIDALHPAALNAKTSPTLHALMQAGRFTLNGRSTEPPKTLIAHAAMLTGLPPAQNGKRDNDWQPGEPQVAKPTLFDDARQAGYRTAYYFSKPKLGYLVNAAVDEYGLEPEEGIAMVRAYFQGEGRRFAFLHLSGLEWAGGDFGWLSQEYLDELTTIDASLAPLFDDLRQRGSFVIVVTSDHAGHAQLHGTNHPEDYKLPLIVVASVAPLPRLPKGSWPVTGLRSLVRKLAQ
ncbi:MAG: alkaline phosphatase family protein [Gammaproteobacteria bacterium]|nr:alkaline phosphatase family protein [Gammaproteobacteria bacterium]MBU4006193.1 alkaline phosphatase family protein [Gammaproteobacteria bacterium]MBU4022648.1 alkaline phosphatase family protein [Gammaproteobacteria bacterium]MBU4097148.1 alkaline phosphatase family protein [Gammaproteobacteria bacterium]MBU4146940.1 alkaline phosphatase family protein [Gammaproteobacteria bacterium]